MRKLLLFILASNLFFSFGQQQNKPRSRSEAYYITQSDSFLIKKIGPDRFQSYFKYRDFFFYSLKGNIMTCPKHIRDTTVNFFVTIYMVDIPEICFNRSVNVIYNKKIGKRYLRDSIEVPQYILNKSQMNFIDSGAVWNLIQNLNIEKTKVSYLECKYSEECKCFVWSIEESADIKDDTPSSWTYNLYLIDAVSGQLLKQKKGEKRYYVN